MINLSEMMEELKRPGFLSPGAKIGIVSTARKISPEELQPAIDEIQSWGFQVVLGDALFLEHHQFAGKDEDRARDLQRMIDDPSIDGIICARGGYGTVRLLDRLDFSRFRQNPKWIAGYSDVTALHAHLNHVLRVESIHSTMPVSFKTNTRESLESLRDAFLGELSHYSFDAKGVDCEFEGELIGGNLSILYSLSGSPEAIQPKGKILFLEDLDEYLYHIDRMMMNLRRSGQLEGLKAILLGGMTDMNDNAVPYGKNAVEIIREHCEELEIPLIDGFTAGHGTDNRALFLGRRCRLSGKRGKFELKFI